MKDYDTFRSNHRIAPAPPPLPPTAPTSVSSDVEEARWGTSSSKRHTPTPFLDLSLTEKFKFLSHRGKILIWEYLILSLIIIFGVITLCLYFTKHSLLKTGKRTAAKVFDLLLYEFLLTTASLFIFHRISTISIPKKFRPWAKRIRAGLIAFALIFCFITQLSYLFYYISLPDEFVIPTIW